MRWLVRIILTLVTLVILAVGALFLIPSDRIARILETQFEKNTGRQLTLSEGVRTKFFPRIGVELQGVAISNASWSEAGPLLEADALEVQVTLGALLGGEVVVEAFEVNNPVIRLETGADGVGNWEFLTEMGGDDSGGQTNIEAVSLPKASITNGTVSFVDVSSGASYTLTELDATLSAADMRAQAQLDLSARLEGQPFAVSAALDGVQQLLDGEVRGVDLGFTAGGSSIDFNGKAGLEPVQAQGDLKADIADQKAIFVLMGATPPRIPAGMGQRTQLAGALTMSSTTQFALRDVTIDLDQNRLQGDLDVTLADKPVVTARITGDQIDFSAMSTDTSQGDGAANVQAGGWSDAFLDVSGLNAVDGTFSLRLGGLDLGSIKLGATSMNGTLDNSRLVLDLGQVSVFDGGVTGQFVVNNRSGLSVGGDMMASDVSTQRLLSDFAGFDRLVGRARMRLKFLASGSSMDQLMNDLSGSGTFNVGSGELLGLDIGGMLRNLDLAYQGAGSKTVFNAISATFSIDQGILSNNDLDFQAELVTAKGAGTLGIGPQNINYRLDPTALASETSGGVRVPVLIEGPWSNISFRPDLGGLLELELEEEKEKLKEAAKAKIAEKLLGEGLVPSAEAEAAGDAAAPTEDGAAAAAVEEPKSIEDQLKDSLEDKAKDQLKKLFGGN
ncbi:MAG: AsmA family protein [Paracoccaceae bacterium]